MYEQKFIIKRFVEKKYIANQSKNMIVEKEFVQTFIHGVQAFEMFVKRK
jgi:hypothetical protein